MNFCPRCGAKLLPYQNSCTNCGLNLHTAQQLCTPANPVTQTRPTPSQPSPVSVSKRSTPYFVWSVILFLFLNPLGAPLAIMASIYSSRAHAGNPDLENIRMARLLCILSTVITAVTLLILVLSMILQSTL